METRTCLNCGEALKGRIDKKFCDDPCRTQYNNRLNSGTSALVRNINHALKRNRRIMGELLGSAADGKARSSGRKLLEKGYNFNYHTHLYKTKTGTTYYYCYEYGYLPLDNDNYLLVKRQRDG